MPDLKNLTYVIYEEAEPAAKAVMDEMIDFMERRQTMKDEAKKFGADAELRFNRSVAAIQSFFEDPSSPEADPAARYRLRDEYKAAAENLALALGAGEEVLRRYDAYYIENTAEAIMMSPDDPSAQSRLSATMACRDLLYHRLQDLGKRDAQALGCDAIARLEGGQQFSVALARGLPLDEPISVRKAPLKLSRPGTGP